MRTIYYVLAGAAVASAVTIGVLSRTGPSDSVDLTDINWGSFSCRTDADRPYVSIYKQTNGKYGLTVLVPVCTGTVEFTSASYDGKGIYNVLFTARVDTDSVLTAPKVTKVVFHTIEDILSTTQKIVVQVVGDGVDEGTTVLTTDADDESSGMPMNEVAAMHYNVESAEVSGFVYGTQRYDPTPTTWAHHSIPVDLLGTSPTAMTTFIRIPMEPNSPSSVNYCAWLRFNNGTHGRSFSFVPDEQ